MKVALNARFYTHRISGVERYAREITREVAARLPQDSFRAIAPRGAAADEVLPYELHRAGRLTGHAWEQLELPRLLPADTDVLWSPSNVGPVSVRSQVVTLHDVFSITRPEWVSRPFHTWYSLLLPQLTMRVKHIITVSEWSRTQIVETLPVSPERVTVIAEGVGAQFTPPGSATVSSLKERYELPEEFILILGSIEPRKNLRRTVAAWSSLPDSVRLPLVIAGGRGLSRVFGSRDEEAMIDHPDIRWLGYVPDEDLPALYGSATLFVYVPLEEGFGLPPIEALACGTSVLTSATSAMLEYCEGYATLVDPNSVEAIASGFDAALKSIEPAAARTRRAASVRQQFDWGVAATETIRVLAAASAR